MKVISYVRSLLKCRLIGVRPSTRDFTRTTAPTGRDRRCSTMVSVLGAAGLVLGGDGFGGGVRAATLAAAGFFADDAPGTGLGAGSTTGSASSSPITSLSGLATAFFSSASSSGSSSPGGPSPGGVGGSGAATSRDGWFSASGAAPASL